MTSIGRNQGIIVTGGQLHADQIATGPRAKATMVTMNTGSDSREEAVRKPAADAEPRAFIVHGHDQTAKLALKNYLQNVVGLPEPIILHERPSMGRTIVEKFEEEAANVDLVLVLLTPDDRGASTTDSDDLKRRARQNVVFELGYFLGYFGRRSGKVILLHSGPLELPSDIAGLIYIDISNGIEAAGEDIRREVHRLELSE